MAMIANETTNLFKMNYLALLKTLEVEKRDHPETYAANVRLAESVRQGFILSTGAAEDFPELPKPLTAR